MQVFKARYHAPWQWTFEDAHGTRQVLQSTPIEIQQRPLRSEKCPGSCDGQDYELAVQRSDSAVLRFVVYGVFSRTDQHTMYVGECNGPRIECRANGFAEPYSIFHVKDYHLGAGASLHPLNGQILATHTVPAGTFQQVFRLEHLGIWDTLYFVPEIGPIQYSYTPPSATAPVTFRLTQMAPAP